MPKASQRHQKKTEKTTRLKKIYILPIILVALVLLGWIAYAWLDKELGYELYSQPKSEAQQNLKAVADSFNFPGRLVSDTIEDNNCSQTKVGLQTYHSCSLVAKKYYVNSGESSANLRLMHDTLVSEGWRLSQSVNVEHLEKRYFLDNSPSQGSISYHHPGGKPGLYTSYYKAVSYTHLTLPTIYSV